MAAFDVVAAGCPRKCPLYRNPICPGTFDCRRFNIESSHRGGCHGLHQAMTQFDIIDQSLGLRHAPIAKRRQCSHVYRQCSY